MVDDVFGKEFNKEDHVKQLISILDSDGDGVIEYDEWKKVAKKATSILQPAILLQVSLTQSSLALRKTRVRATTKPTHSIHFRTFFARRRIFSKLGVWATTGGPRRKRGR
tara:strand:+ start:281 stop:610 length:330 start_codon:yes stop_codon:yes gene_type:complete